MGNSLRCCLACIVPCGALDLIRIVHLNGYVEEITRLITAGEFLKNYPNYVLSQPCSHGMVRKIMLLSPHSQLKRGSIYFLIPRSSLPSNHPKLFKMNGGDDRKHVKKVDVTALEQENNVNTAASVTEDTKTAGRHRRRRSSRGKSGVWHPQLQTISED